MIPVEEVIIISILLISIVSSYFLFNNYFTKLSKYINKQIMLYKFKIIENSFLKYSLMNYNKYYVDFKENGKINCENNTCNIIIKRNNLILTKKMNISLNNRTYLFYEGVTKW